MISNELRSIRRMSSRPKLSAHGIACREGGQHRAFQALAPRQRKRLEILTARSSKVLFPASLVPARPFPRCTFDWFRLSGLWCSMDILKRTEDRTPMKITVDLSSLDIRTPAQEGITENVSPRGARVLTSKPWKPNDRLNVRSLLGNFRSRARVVYCVPVDAGQFAIGLQLFATAGNWKFPS